MEWRSVYHSPTNMHTYLPEEQKKALRSEYITRLMIIILLVGAGVCVAGTIFILPAYVAARSDARDKEYQLSNEEQKKLLAQVKENELQVKYATDFSSRFLEGSNNPTLIRALLISNESLVPGVKLTSFELSTNASSTIDLRVSGVSANRDALLAFRKKIEVYKGVQKVELPVSDLAKSKDLSFVMRITAN